MAPILNHLDLVCADMNASIAFYRLLGARIPKGAVWTTKSGAHHVVITFGNGIELALGSTALARAYNTGYRGKGRGGNLVIGFSVATRRAVDAAFAKLTAAGHAAVQPPFDAFWGSRYAIVADPDGNHVGIMSPMDAKHRSAGPEL